MASAFGQPNQNTAQAVLELVHSFNGPVRIQQLLWEVECERKNEFECLGPRPRRSTLMLHLGDLIDQGLVLQSVDGFEAVDHELADVPAGALEGSIVRSSHE